MLVILCYCFPLNLKTIKKIKIDLLKVPIKINSLLESLYSYSTFLPKQKCKRKGSPDNRKSKTVDFHSILHLIVMEVEYKSLCYK